MVFPSESSSNAEIAKFSHEHQLDWLCEHTVIGLKNGDYSLDKVDGLQAFLERIDKELLNHPVIHFNDYCSWFQHGHLPMSVVKEFVVQFSVFSNQFLIAQLQKMLNAETLEEMRASKEILANEIGVIFNGSTAGSDGNKDMDGDPEFVSLDGSIDGGKFRFKAAHFEWLLKMGESLGLGFTEMGKRRHGSISTLFFCDELSRLYGSDNYLTATAASYAVENWAAAGFWDELVEGFVKFKKENSLESLPLAFFTWHSKLEANHAQHTREELEEFYFTHDVNEDAFIIRGNEMLDGVKAFWDGLDQNRQAIH